MPDFPEIGYGTVTGRFLAGVLDSDDAAAAPDVQPLQGAVVFSATASVLLVTGAAPPATMFPLPVRVKLDADGNIAHEGSLGVSLWATDDPDGNPVDWQWHVHFELTHKGKGVYRAPFNFELPTGSTVDLTVVAPLIVLDDGTVIIRGPEGPAGPGVTDLITAKGDMVAGTGPQAAAIIHVGADGEYLTPEPTAETGLAWKPLPTGVKVYATLAEAEAVRATETGTVHIPAMNLAFPNLVSQNFDTFKATGAADLIITTTVSDALSPNQVIKECVQEFHIRALGSEYPDVLRMARVFQFNATSGVTTPALPQWQVLADLPGTGYRGVAVTDPFGMWWAIPGFSDSALIGDQNGNWKAVPSSPLSTPSSVMKRDAEGQAQVADPTDALDIANKQYVDAVVDAVGFTILTGSGAPADSAGDPGDFYIDTDTDTMYGPKLADLYAPEPPILTGVPESFPLLGSPALLGVRFTVDVPGQSVGVRVYRPAGMGAEYATYWLYDAAGAPLMFADVQSGVDEAGWVEVSFDAPVVLTVGAEYRVAYYLAPTLTHAYSAAGGFPQTGGHVTLLGAVSGPMDFVTAPSVDDPGSFWVEPLFSAPVTTQWPVAIAPAPGGGGLKVYADMAALDAVQTGEVGTLHVDNLAAAFPELAVSHPKAFSGTGPADLVITSESADTSDADPSTFSMVIQSFRIGSNAAPGYLDAQRTIYWQREDGVTTQVEPWRVEPAMKHYPYISSLDAVRTSEVATVHVPNLAAAFPNLAAAGTVTVYAFGGTGPADLVVTSQVTDFYQDGSIASLVHQSFWVADASVNGPSWMVERTLAIATSGAEIAEPWEAALKLPDPDYLGRNWVPISNDLGSYTVAFATSDSTPASIVYRDADGRSRVSDPAAPLDIVNLQTLQAQIAAAPVPPHTHPEIGGTHRFLFDATPAGDPGAGRVSIENAGGQNRILRVSKTDADGGPVNLAVLAINDSVALSGEGATPTIYARGYAITVATDAVTHWEFTVTRESGVGALPADATPLLLNVTLANGAGSSVPAGLPVYATMAELNAVVTAEVGVLHVNSLAVTFPALALLNQTFAADGPADLVVTSSLTDQPAGGAGMSDLLQTFQITDANNSLKPLRVWRFIRIDTAAGASTQVGNWTLITEIDWPAAPAPGDLFVSKGGKGINRLGAPGHDGQVLTGDLIQSTKMAWRDPVPAPYTVAEWQGVTIRVDDSYANRIYALVAAEPITIILPAVFPTGASIIFVLKTASPATVQAATDAIVLTASGLTFLPSGRVTCTKLNYNEWHVSGDLTLP